MRLLATAVPAYRHQSVFKKCKSFEIATQWLRHASSNSATALPSNVGILGGGISGLSSAIFILMMHEKKYPGTKLPKITIYEANNRLGGWMQTAKVIPGAGLEPVYMEQGPRTIRLSSIGGLIFTALVRTLDSHLFLQADRICLDNEVGSRTQYTPYSQNGSRY